MSPGRDAMVRAASSTPGMKDTRSSESCRIVSVSPVAPSAGPPAAAAKSEKFKSSAAWKLASVELAPLARVEGQVALETLFRRYPDLRLGVPASEITWAPGFLRGLTGLPLVF